jgi:hypothetical protein
MDKHTSADASLSRSSEPLQTRFATAEQTASLMQMLDLSLDDLSQVSGGNCNCPTCCCGTHTRPAAVKI